MELRLFDVLGLLENPLDFEHNYNCIVDAIEYCKENNLNGIRLPKGTFCVYNRKALQLREALFTGEIGATDDVKWHEERNVTFDINGFESFCVLGDDTKLLFNGLIGAFDFRNVKNVTLKGVVIDWVEPLYFTADVKNIEGKKIIFEPDISLRGTEPVVSFQNIERNALKQKGMSVFCDISNVSSEDGRYFSFTSEDTFGLSVGDGIIARYIYNFSPIIHFYLCESVDVENVTIHSGCGMGVIAHKSGSFNFENYRVVPKENSPMSSNTDATHFISCNGRIHFNNCEFEGMGDDAVNVHGFYINVMKIIDEKTVLAKIEAAVQDGITDIPDIDDRVEFCHRDSLYPFAEAQIATVEADEKKLEMIISFKESIPEGVTEGCSIGNVSKVAELLVENCTVRNIRGRAMLIQNRGTIIRNNLFEGCTGQGVHISTATGWWESIGTRNIEISNNRFINCGYGITKYCDAVGVVVEVEAEKAIAGVHKNIVIKDNYIEGENTGIKLSGAENVTLRNNVFVGCKSNYDISDCKDIELDGEII